MTLKVSAVLIAAVFSTAAFASTPVLSNASFESNNLGTSASGYLYSTQLGFLGPEPVAASGWSFLGGSGLSRNGTAWGGHTVSGNTFAFLQNAGGAITQTFSHSATANYAFSFDLAQRTNTRSGGPQTISVVFDGATIWSGTPQDSWTTLSASVIGVGPGIHSISFRGTNLTHAYDTSVFVDNVQMTVTPVPEPESYALMLAGLGLMGTIARRRKVARR